MLLKLMLIVLLMLSVGVVEAQQATAPRITEFASDVDNIDRVQLISGNFYITVRWQVENHPTTATLLFEQLLGDGSYINIERPRPNPWVSSSGSGLVELVYPGDTIDEVVVRLRVVDTTTQTTLTEQALAIDITENPTRPQIDTFYADSSDISLVQLRGGRARVRLYWHTANRVPEMSLAFEQVLPNGRIVNVELPRLTPWVNSQDSGIVVPVYPGDGIIDVQLQVRLYVVATGETLDTRTLFVMIREYLQAPVPTATPTRFAPVPTNTPSGTGVNSFRVTPTSVQEGDNLTVSWDITGGQPTRLWVSYVGQPRFDMPQVLNNLVGTMTITAPYGVNQVILSLMTEPGDVLQSITVPIQCRIQWFNASSEYCPEAPAQTLQAAYQAFEHGYMVWRQDTRMIWIYFNQTNTFFVRPDTYTGGAITFDETPPAGLVQPINGFGKIWVEEAWMRERLGWALADEVGYTMTYQQTPWAIGTRASRHRTFTLPNGRTISATIDDF